ncbi:MAG: 30S ribosomal protein S21 [Candidatus Margulisbacteria bacterium]|nr:30S ribosomal protein S21 [Candidatus Margulisiibacteriota bacterium]
MAESTKKPNESFDKVLRRFKKKVKEEGILQEVKKREFYEKPSEIKKRRDRAAARRIRAKQMADEW